MKAQRLIIPALLPALLLGACASVPSGPSVMALPGSGKSFEEFRRDDIDCRQYARAQSGGDAKQAAADSGLRSAAIGTAVGAAAGAALGGHQGAGAGAATGLLFGSVVGADAAQSSARGTQRAYDNAYVQCMYAKGEKVPVSGNFSRYQSQPPAYPARSAYPPPPAGNPPPPPPDAYPR